MSFLCHFYIAKHNLSLAPPSLCSSVLETTLWPLRQNIDAEISSMLTGWTRIKPPIADVLFFAFSLISLHLIPLFSLLITHEVGLLLLHFTNEETEGVRCEAICLRLCDELTTEAGFEPCRVRPHHLHSLAFRALPFWLPEQESKACILLVAWLLPASCWVSWGVRSLASLHGRFQHTGAASAQQSWQFCQPSLTAGTALRLIYNWHREAVGAHAGSGASVHWWHTSCHPGLSCPRTKDLPHRWMSFLRQGRQTKMPNPC